MQVMKRNVAVVTVGRSDFSILKPLCELLNDDPFFDFGLVVGGAHFDETSGYTYKEVEKTGLPIWGRVVGEKDGADAEDVVNEMANQTRGFGEFIAQRSEPIDLCIILGDRYEALAAAMAFVPHNIPIAHISGGSVTRGAIDDVFRHCITKLSALHFCEIEEFAQRIHQLGEARERIHIVGALGLDGIRRAEFQSFENFKNQFGFKNLVENGFAIATLHPETRAPELTEEMTDAMIAALVELGIPVVYTHPNADHGSHFIIERIEQAAATHEHHYTVRNFGADWFYTAMHYAKLCIGNSSSGIIEAASFGLPVVDIGDRQYGRFHGLNVLHCGHDKSSIQRAIAQALSPAFEAESAKQTNPYGDGRSAEKIVGILKQLDWQSLNEPKEFVDVSFAARN